MLESEHYEPIDYPTSDGLPLGETDVHRNQILDLIHGLEMHYLDDPSVYVSGNLLMFYQEGEPRKHVSPDVLVAVGRPKHERDFYQIWVEGKAPDFIIEVTSKSTRTEDLGTKKGLYALMGVRDYFIFDPLREYLTPSLRAYRLEGEDYLPVVGDPMVSLALGLTLRIVDNRLRLFDANGVVLPTRLETELAKRQAEEERDRATEERDRATEERDRATEERDEAVERARAAELEAGRLRAELERLQGR